MGACGQANGCRPAGTINVLHDTIAGHINIFRNQAFRDRYDTFPIRYWRK